MFDVPVSMDSFGAQGPLAGVFGTFFAFFLPTVFGLEPVFARETLKGFAATIGAVIALMRGGVESAV